MFARDFVHVNKPFEQVAPRFAGAPTWLEPIVDTALSQATARHSALALPCPTALDAQRAHCSRGSLRVRDGALVVPLTWDFDRDPLALSPIESDLTVAPVDPTMCVLTLEARLRGPVGPRSTAVQHAVEAVLRGFLHGLANAVDPDRASGDTMLP